MITSDLAKVRYPILNTTLEYEIPFKFNAENHLVLITSDANDTVASRTTLELGTDYELSGVGNEDGGVATLSEYLSTSLFLTIALDVPYTQEVDLENQGTYSLETLENMVDGLTQQTKQLKEITDRCPQTSISGTQGGNAIIEEIESNVALSAEYRDSAEGYKNDAYAALASANDALAAAIAARDAAIAALAAAGLPSSITGQSKKLMVVKQDESGYEFTNSPEMILDNTKTKVSTPGNSVMSLLGAKGDGTLQDQDAYESSVYDLVLNKDAYMTVRIAKGSFSRRGTSWRMQADISVHCASSSSGLFTIDGVLPSLLVGELYIFLPILAYSPSDSNYIGAAIENFGGTAKFNISSAAPYGLGGKVIHMFIDIPLSAKPTAYLPEGV